MPQNRGKFEVQEDNSGMDFLLSIYPTAGCSVCWIFLCKSIVFLPILWYTKNIEINKERIMSMFPFNDTSLNFDAFIRFNQNKPFLRIADKTASFVEIRPFETKQFEIEGREQITIEDILEDVNNDNSK